MTTIAVLGATGQVGHQLAQSLLEGGVGVRAFGRSAERLAALAGRGAEPVVGDVEQVRFLSEALRGSDGLFAMLPPAYAHADPLGHAARVADTIAAAAQVARIRHVVVLSSVGAQRAEGTGLIRALHLLEQRFLQVPGMHLVFLRAAYFMENFLGSIGLIRQAGINGGPFAADRAMPMVATRDIAAVAASLLRAPAFTGQAVRGVHGPRDHTFREATAILGAAIGRPDLAYRQFSREDARQAFLGFGFSEGSVDLFLDMAAALSDGRADPAEPRSAETTTPTTLASFAREVFAPAFNG